MDINDLVPSLKTCKRAQKLGWVEETYFVWGFSKDAGKYIVTDHRYNHFLANSVFSAPTLQEILWELGHTGEFDGNDAAVIIDEFNAAEAALYLWCEIKEKRANRMNLKRLVPTLETCKRLKEAGYPQGETYFFWQYNNPRDGWGLYDSDYYLNAADPIAAPTLQELLGELGGNYDITLSRSKKRSGYDIEAGITPFIIDEIHNANPTEAAALLWLELKGASYDKP